MENLAKEVREDVVTAIDKFCDASQTCPQCSFLEALYYQFQGEVQSPPVSCIQRPPNNPFGKIDNCQSF